MHRRRRSRAEFGLVILVNGAMVLCIASGFIQFVKEPCMDFDFKNVFEGAENCWIIFWWQDLFTNGLLRL